MTQRVDKDTLPLDKPRRTPNHPTKSHIVKTKVDGKEKIIRFGEQGASTAGKPKAGESDRMKAKRASFKARHAANIAKGKSSAAWWSDKIKWAEGGAVRNRRTRGTPALDLIEQMRRSASRSEPEVDIASLARTQRRTRQDRLPVPPIPPRPPAAPGVLESVPTPVATPQNFPGETANDATPTRNVTYDGNNPLVIAAANAAQRYNIPVPLFLAQIQQESRFDPNARSRVGALGLGQLMPATARELGVDPRDPMQNLDGSARYMRQMLDRFGEVPLALAAYNAGPGRVRRAGNTIPNIPETQNYVSTIMRNAGIQGYAEGGLAELDQKYAGGGRVRRGIRALTRATRDAPQTNYPVASEMPRFKVEPEPGQAFDDWVDSLYSPSVIGPDNVIRFPSLMYRGVSDDELNAAINAGSIRPLSESSVYIENSPDRYVGGGAYGARRAGAILQFDVGGLPSTSIQSPNVRNLVESGVPEIPLERVRRIWRWDPDRESHVLMSESEMAKFLRRAQPEENARGGLAELDQKYAEGGAVMAGPMAYDPNQIEALAREVEGGAEPRGYAEGGEVSSPEDKEYDRRLMERWRQDQGYRVDNPTWPEQRAAIARAGREAADTAAELLLPQSPLDFALMAALGPGGRAVRIPAAAALAAMEPSEAEAGRVRRLVRALTPDEAPMVALHNVRPQAIERMGKSGDVAVAPSIAVTRADEPFESFGPISLVADPATVDPRRTPVYARDVYTPRYPDVETRNVRGREREVIRYMDENTGEWRSLPHSPLNALRVMRREPWRGGEDFITDNWLLGQLAPQFRSMSELQGARGRLVSASDPALGEFRSRISDLSEEWAAAVPRRDFGFYDSLMRNWAEAAQRGPEGLNYINREYYGGRIPQDVLDRTAALLREGRNVPATYFEAKPQRVVPLSEFRGAIVPEDTPSEVMDVLRRSNIENIARYARPEDRVNRVQQFRDLFFTGAPAAAGVGAALREGEAREYARGGKVEAGIEGMYRRYYAGGGVDGGDPADNDTSASTAEGQAAAGGVSGAGAGPTGAGAGSPADAGPGPDTGPSGVGGGGMSMADPEGTAAAANMNTAVQAAAMGYGYDPVSGFGGTGLAPAGFYADPTAYGALSAMVRGDITPAQALGYVSQSAIPGATIGTQIDEFGNPSRAANVDFGQMIGTLGGTMAGLATGFGPGAGRVGGMVGSALGQALGYEPGVVSYSPGVYGGPETPDTSGDDYLNYGMQYGFPTPPPGPVNYNYGPSWVPYYQGIDFR